MTVKKKIFKQPEWRESVSLKTLVAWNAVQALMERIGKLNIAINVLLVCMFFPSIFWRYSLLKFV
jgi:hypothetical protein